MVLGCPNIQEREILEQGCADSSISSTRQRSKLESMRRASVCEEANGKGISGRSLNIRWKAGEWWLNGNKMAHRLSQSNQGCLFQPFSGVMLCSRIEQWTIGLLPGNDGASRPSQSKILCSARCNFMLAGEVALAESVVYHPHWCIVPSGSRAALCCVWVSIAC
jgi:hypothetical protein